MPKPVLTSSVALATAILLSPAAAAFDCAKATSDTEKSICANPAVKAADDEMSAAYAALLPTLEGDQPAMLRANQVAWLKLREQNCGWQEQASEKSACLLEKTNERTSYLSARPASGPGMGDGARLVPYLFARAFGKSRCSADISLYRFPGTAEGPGERTLNGWVNDLTTSLEGEYGGFAEGDLPDGMECEYAASASLTYASADLVAMNASIYMFGGGAHGNTTATSITLDRKTGKALAFADIFPADALKPLSAICAEGIRTEKLARFADSGTKEEVDKLVSDDMANYGEVIEQGVGDMANWLIYEDRADIYFAPYALGSFAEGDYVCSLAKADLVRSAGSRGWIIP